MVWQWVRQDGRSVSPELVTHVVREELDLIRDQVGPDALDGGRFADARTLLLGLCLEESFTELLTLPAYQLIKTPRA
jgi:malate synthase